jgi:hypothetical protein
MVRTGSELGDKTDQYIAATAVSDALLWTHAREAKEQKLAPRSVIYQMEAAEFMHLVKAWQQHMLPPYGRHMDPVSPDRNRGLPTRTS